MPPIAIMIIHPTVEKALLPPGQKEVLTLLADPLAAALHQEVLLRRDRLLPQAG